MYERFFANKKNRIGRTVLINIATEISKCETSVRKLSFKILFFGIHSFYYVLNK